MGDPVSASGPDDLPRDEPNGHRASANADGADPNGFATDEDAADASASAASGLGAADPLDRLLSLIGPRLDELRSFVDDAGSRWRGDAARVGEGTRQRLTQLCRELGLVTREEWDELDLRLAQLEHRLGLVEKHLDER